MEAEKRKAQILQVLARTVRKILEEEKMEFTYLQEIRLRIGQPLDVYKRQRFASEDIGMADSNALQVAVAAYQACHFIGMPECSVHLTQAVVYMSLVPKSNSVYMAYEAAKKDAAGQLAEPVPLNIRNGVTKLMKELDYGRGYKYAHDFEDKLTSMQCLPDSLLVREYYKPGEEGAEGRCKTRLKEIKDWKKMHK